ncbi:MAG: LCP family protein, partial [Coprobacillaceae bacterium]
TKLACGSYTETKITHAGWYGVSCMQDTIEDLLDIEIDYYVTINFKGVVHLVDALGGVEIDVPIEFCEQNSDRSFADDAIICLEEGLQTLTGEEALAFARHRKTLEGGDITRGKHQQMVIEAAMKKATSIRSVDEVQSILDTLSNNMKTNMDLSQIISFYEVGLDILSSASSEDVSLNIQHMTLSGYDATIYDELNNLELYNYVPYLGSAKDISNAMKENLELKEITAIKTFSFSINEPYETTNIGAGVYNESDRYPLFGSYVGKNIDTVTKTLSAKGITVKVVNVPGTSSMSNGEIVNQDISTKKRMDRVKTVTFTVVKKETTTTDTDTDTDTETLSIELIGNSSVTITEGGSYTDAGF